MVLKWTVFIYSFFYFLRINIFFERIQQKNIRLTMIMPSAVQSVFDNHLNKQQYTNEMLINNLISNNPLLQNVLLILKRIDLFSNLSRSTATCKSSQLF